MNNPSDAVAGFLVLCGDFFQAVWNVIAHGAAVLGDAVRSVLQPILGPLLSRLNPICTALGDGVFALLGPLPAWLGLGILSMLAGVVMLLAFRCLSNQTGIARAKDDMKANLLALKLFKDDLGVAFRAQGRILWAILRLQRYVLTPVLFMALPMLLALGQMGLRYQWRPLKPDETALLIAQLNRTHRAVARLEPCEGVVVEAGPVAGGGKVVWRLRAAKPGSYNLRLALNGFDTEKEIVIGNGLQRVSAERVGHGWISQLLHPAEPALPLRYVAGSLQVTYPPRDSWFNGSNTWVLSFLAMSMLTALILRPVFGVKF